MPVVSILDSDLYKFTMQQAVLELYPCALAEYRFINRRLTDKFDEHFIDLLQSAINAMASLALTSEEAIWLANTCPFLKPSYIEYLRNYRFNPSEVSVAVNKQRELCISITGPWHRTILWEVPLMATISELYFCKWNNNKHKWNYVGQKKKIQEKIRQLEEQANPCFYADFGTRRRRSIHAQQLIVEQCVKYGNWFIGTSNPYFAMKFNTKPIGTQAHEWIQAHSALASLRHANRDSMDAWQHVFQGNLGIALTDTYGLNSFFNDFNLSRAKLWDGIRHDSGCPFAFINRAVEHYKKLRIDLQSKTLVFSDSLDPSKAICIQEECLHHGIKCSFGIGTNFTNDFPGPLKALNIVIKLWSINGIPVVKLGEGNDKATGDRDAIRVARWVHLGIPLDATL